jgi:hypothetical protein
MKKLLLGSALASAVLFSGSSFAETNISGYLETTVGFTSSTTTGTPDNSLPTGIGHEVSIDLSTSKELSNGLKMEAGFGIENQATGGTDQYLKLSQGGTYFAIGNDVTGVADNVSQEDFTPHIAQAWHDAGIGAGAITGTNTTHGGNGFYLVHKNDNFTIESVYSPDLSATNTTAASANGAGQSSGAAASSGYDLAISGSFGVPGLKVGYGISRAKAGDDSVAANTEQEGDTYGVQYSMSGFTVGYGKTENKAVASTTKTEITTYGVAYKVSDALSVGVYKGDVSVTGTALDEEYKSAQIGYDFGGMGITVGYYTADTIGGTSGTDREKLELRTVTKF